MKTSFLWGLTVAGLASVIFLVSNVQAAAMQISPVRQDVEISPGKKGQVKIRVTNPTDTSLRFRVVVNDFTARGQTGQPALRLDESSRSARSLQQFVKLPDSVTIPANETRPVTINIAVPSDAEPGGYYGAIRVIPTTNGDQQSINVEASVASLILLRVPGVTVEKLSLESFQLRQSGQSIERFMFSPDRVEVGLNFKNTGNVHLAPVGQIYIKRGGEVISSVPFNTDSPLEVVLPGTIRKWQVELDKQLEFGRYQIGILMSYGSNNHSISAERAVWVLPWPIAVGVAVGVLVAIAIVADIMRRRARRRSRPHRTRLVR